MFEISVLFMLARSGGVFRAASSKDHANLTYTSQPTHTSPTPIHKLTNSFLELTRKFFEAK